MGIRDFSWSEKRNGDNAEYTPDDNVPAYGRDSDEVQEGFSENADQLHRRLNNRQIQLIAIGGAIGTALFVSIGSGLHSGGPGSLFLAYTFQSIILALVSNCLAEMTVLMPVSGGFVRLAGEWVDEAFGFMAGWNFFFYEALLIPFEITALTTVLGFWRDDIPPWSVPVAAIILYAALNVLAVRVFGEAEFWLAGGKVILIFLLFCFTFITMVGGNPQHDAYGFRYWDNPGSFAVHLDTGALGRFEGFLAGLWSAAFCVVGPEYLSMVSAEAVRPRVYVKNAFKTVYWRFGLFFIVGSLAAGIVIPYNDKKLEAVLNGEGGGGTAAASPYVIAMQNLGIGVLPHIVNALLVTSIFSAGNGYTYCATRTLYGLALEKRAPAFFKKCTPNGVPIYCFLVVMIFPCLSFLQVSSGSNDVLTWLISLITAGGIIDYIIITVTYICFWNAIKAQGVDRRTFPYRGWFQPYSAYIGLVWMILIVIFFGYSSFHPWSVTGFFTNYTMCIIDPVLYIAWKVIKRTKFVKPSEADLVWERPVIDAYEETFIDPPVGFWTEMGDLIGLGRLRNKNKKDNKGNTRDRRVSSVAELEQRRASLK